MIGSPLKRRDRGLEGSEALAEWNARCATSRALHATYVPAIETLDSRKGDALDVSTLLRGERAAVYFD